MKKSVSCVSWLLLFCGLLTGKLTMLYADNENVEKITISKEAKDIVLHELQNLVVAMSNIPNEISNEKERSDYVTMCFEAWRNEVVRQGVHCDETIKEGKNLGITLGVFNTDAYNPSLGIEMGFERGHRLAQEWGIKISQEKDQQYSVLFSSTGEPPKTLSRNEIIKGHPHVEAIIYLSKILTPKRKVSNAETDEN